MTDPGEEWDPHAEERDNVRRLLRWIAAFLAWPGLSIAFIFLLDLDDHMGHFLISLTAGLAGVTLWFAAPQLADRAHPAS